MNYLQFLSYKNKMLVEQPNLINLAENNLYERLSCLVPRNLDYPKTYRCHLAEKILNHYRLKNYTQGKITITQGVRDSLNTLFDLYDNWIIPKDQYPWYQQKLKEKNKSFSEYSTLGQDDMFDNLPNGNLLITYPIKLFSYKENNFEKVNNNFVKKLYEFCQNKNNHLFIDAVYDLGSSYLQSFQFLNLTNVTILYSYSKSFLLPNHCGFIISNENFQENFFSKEIDYKKISLINHLLQENCLYQTRTRNMISDLNFELIKLNNYLAEFKKISLITGLDCYLNKQSYLFYSKTSHEEYLNHNILTIPESVFGGKGNGSIVSSL